MRQLTLAVLVVTLGMAALAANAATDLQNIREAVKGSSASFSSGYGYFIASHIPDARTTKVAQDEAEQQAKESKQPVTPKDYRTVARSYWAFKGENWRFDRITVFPEDRVGSTPIQVAWDGKNASSLVGKRGLDLESVDRARMMAALEMIAPLTTGEDRNALNDKSAKYLGDELIDGENTHHVSAKVGSLTYDLWISPSHGYQTKRIRRASEPGVGKMVDYRVLSFKQYDGIWLPETIEELRYDVKDGKLVNPDVRRFHITEFHVNASIPGSEFRLDSAETNATVFLPDKLVKLLQPMTQEEIKTLLAPVPVDK